MDGLAERERLERELDLEGPRGNRHLEGIRDSYGIDAGLFRVELEVRPSALQAIAKKALKRKTGARGLRSILENVLLDTMYELPTMESVSKVVIDESTIETVAPPLMIYADQARVAGSN